MTNILLTGSSRGIGAATRTALAAAGATVVGHGTASGIAADFADPVAPATLWQAALDRLDGRIDVLINNAGVFEPFMVRDATDAQISAAVLTNYAGPIYCSRSAIPLLGGGGHIINISSETVVMQHAMFSLYQSSKAGMERFSEAMRAELEPEGIKVTLLRAGQMTDADMAWTVDPAVTRRFAEENLRRGIDSRARPISAFDSVAVLVESLIGLPRDVHVPLIQAEGAR